jgi:hypothetical protein
MVRGERLPCVAGVACNPPQGFWKGPPRISDHRTHDAPAPGQQHVIYVIYARNDIYGRSVIASEAKQSRELPVRAIKI